MYDDKDFDINILTTEEKNAMIDEMLSTIGNNMDEHFEGMTVEHDKVKEVVRAYKLLQHIAQGRNIKVTYRLHKPYKNIGCVSVTGKDIYFTDTKGFVLLTDLAANVDIYPKTTGVTQIDFTFVGLATDRREEN